MSRHWKRWGPYLSERSWGNPREDYSATANAWEYFPHDHARSRTYRWTEDGIAGICDNHQRLCFAFAFWNGVRSDPEGTSVRRLRAGRQPRRGRQGVLLLPGLHSHALLHEVPVQVSAIAVSLHPPGGGESRPLALRTASIELIDTGIFDENRYFDIFVEYAKNDIDDILVRVTVINRGPDPASLHLLPTLWFRNTWSWGYGTPRPELERLSLAHHSGPRTVAGRVQALDGRTLPRLLFTENETNYKRLFGYDSGIPYTKDAFHRYVIEGEHERGESGGNRHQGLRCYRIDLAPGGSQVLHFRLYSGGDDALPDFHQVFLDRIEEADDFYGFAPASLSDDARSVQRQAFAGLLWSKQFYHYVVEQWLKGDPAQPPPPPERLWGRNHNWIHVYNDDVLSMPDKWEYPWFAAWDLAFPHDSFRDDRSRFRQAPAFALAARMVSCRPTASFPPMSGSSATSIRPCIPGPAGASFRSIRS